MLAVLCILKAAFSRLCKSFVQLVVKKGFLGLRQTALLSAEGKNSVSGQIGRRAKRKGQGCQMNDSFVVFGFRHFE
jgi:hypothetical protein